MTKAELIILPIWFVLVGVLLGIRFGPSCPPWLTGIFGVLLLVLFAWFVTHE